MTKYSSLGLKGLGVVQPHTHSDDRGTFKRVFCQKLFGEFIPDIKILQINRSLTAKPGTVRGLHFQRQPYVETKIIQVLKGRIFDVAVDLRISSPTFLRWEGVELTKENEKILIIPPGFAHGFQTLEPDTELLYFHDNYYTPEAEAGVRFDDRTLSIKWPLEVSNVTDRDRSFELIHSDFLGIEL